MVDGKWKPLDVQTEIVKIKQGDSTITQTIQIKKSDFGFVIEEKDGKALALRLSGFDRPFFMQQFVEMAKSKNLKEFESAMEMLQLPLQNVIYADKQGEISILIQRYNSQTPKWNLTRLVWNYSIHKTRGIR